MWNASRVRITGVWFLVAACLGGSGRPAGADPDPYVDSEMRVEVDAAIERGRAALLELQGKDVSHPGAWNHPAQNDDHPMGVTALCTLALLDVGVPPSDERIQAALGALAEMRLTRSGSVACYLMALRALYAPETDASMSALGVPRSARLDTKALKRRVSRADRDRARQCVDFLMNVRRSAGVWWYHAENATSYDIINTHLTLCGLDAAREMGLRLDRKLWARAQDKLLDFQRPSKGEAAVALRVWSARGDGKPGRPVKVVPAGFVYCDYGSGLEDEPVVTGSRTAAALHSLLLCARGQSRGGALKGPALRAVQQGMAWIQEYCALEDNPKGLNGPWLYFAFALERFFLARGDRRFGDGDWYAPMVRVLLARQHEDGRWQGGAPDGGAYNDRIETALALLILKRSPRTTVTPSETDSER